MAVVNVGRLAAAIEAKGLEVEIRGREMMAFTTFDTPEGRMRAGAGGLRRHVVEMVMEARPLDYLAEIALGMTRAAKDQYPRMKAS